MRGSMNKFEKIVGLLTEARVRLMDGEFQVLSAGDYVRCALTGEKNALADLKYWSVRRQEAYSSAAASLRREIALQRAAKAG